MKKLLELRNKLKAKKPTFTRHDAHKKKRVGTGWRKPKGRQNKMRLGMKGYARSRSTGFSSPKAVRGLSREGLTQRVVFSMNDFEGLDAKKDGIILGRTVGAKKKLALIDHAQKNNFALLNLDADEFKKAVEDKRASKAAKKKDFEKKKAAKKAADKKASEKKSAKKKEDSEVSQEEKKSQEKKEHDKILTTKGDTV